MCVITADIGESPLGYAKNFADGPNYQVLYKGEALNDRVIFYMKLRYEGTLHHIALLKHADAPYWYLIPYQDTFFCTSAAYEESFLVVLQAIRDHAQLQQK